MVRKVAKWPSCCAVSTPTAPEILRRKPYSFPADNWALGIIAYQLLSGAHPFVTGRGTLGETFDRILSGEVGFEGATWALVSPEGKDFVKRLLEQDPAQRMTAAEALDHEVGSSSRRRCLNLSDDIYLTSCNSGSNSTRLEHIWNGSRVSRSDKYTRTRPRTG